MAGDFVKVLTKDNFDDEVVNSNKLVLVDFWAPWCGPCRSVGPIIDELAEEYDGKAVVAKVNVDDEGEVAQKFRIMSIPTIILFKNGEVAEKIIGARSKEDLADLINKHVS